MFEVQVMSSGSNKALNKIATQSSDHNINFRAIKAVDGSNSTFSHTSANDANAWWQVDLQEDVAVEAVNIINRYCSNPSDPSNCLGRLSYAHVDFFDQQGSSVYSTSLGNTTSEHIISIIPSCDSSTSSSAPTTSPTSSPVSPKPTQAPYSSSLSCSDIRRLKIQATTGAPLHFFEVQAFSSGVNRALNKNAIQSSDFKATMIASKAVDDNYGTFSHTGGNDANAWWEVDMIEDYAIESINIINRYCQDNSDPANCLGRLSYANITLIDETGKVVYFKLLGNTTGEHVISIMPTCEADSSPSKAPSTNVPTTKAPSTNVPTTKAPSTNAPTTKAPSTNVPTTKAPSTSAPTTKAPSTSVPTTKAPSTNVPTTKAPSTETNAPTQKPTSVPTSSEISFGTLSNWDTYCVVPKSSGGKFVPFISSIYICIS
jgi:hypothetical protein